MLAVVMRVAGPVPTEVHPYALGQPERQVTARLGEALVYLTDPAVAARIRQHWDAAQYLAACRLPARVSQTWLAPRPDKYPLGVVLRLTGDVDLHTQWIAGRPHTRTPPHLRIQIDQLIWQVCDQQSWRRIGDTWFDAQRYLDKRPGPSITSEVRPAGEEASMNAPPPGVVLLCGSCRHVWEPTAEDWATGHTTCPDCGGWTMTAALDEPKAADTAARTDNQQSG